MAHALAFRRRYTSNETGNRLFLFLFLVELRGIGFSAAADFADHQDTFGFRVFEEHLQAIDKVGAVDRVTADTDTGGLTQTIGSRLVHSFVCQGAGAGYDADLAALVDVTRHNADLAFARCDHTGAVGADQARFGALQGAFDFHHVQNRNTFGDADRQRNFRVDGLEDRIRRKWWRDIDHAGVGTGFFTCIAHGIEYRQVEVFAAALARRHAAHHFRAVGNGLFRMERPLRACKALADNFGVFVDKNGHE